MLNMPLVRKLEMCRSLPSLVMKYIQQGPVDFQIQNYIYIYKYKICPKHIYTHYIHLSICLYVCVCM